MDNGVVKRVDELGRIVIPKDIRKNLKINNGDVLKIYVEGQKIQLAKYSEVSYNIEEIKKIFNSFIEVFSDNIIFTDRESVLMSSMDIVGSKIDSKLQNLINNREYLFSLEPSTYTFNDVSFSGYFYIYPVITSIAGIGSIIIYSNNKIDLMYQNILKFISIYISKSIDISC